MSACRRWSQAGSSPTHSDVRRAGPCYSHQPDRRPSIAAVDLLVLSGGADSVGFAYPTQTICHQTMLSCAWTIISKIVLAASHRKVQVKQGRCTVNIGKVRLVQAKPTIVIVATKATIRLSWFCQRTRLLLQLRLRLDR